jgi:hypothetical protein
MQAGLTIYAQNCGSFYMCVNTGNTSPSGILCMPGAYESADIQLFERRVKQEKLTHTITHSAGGN